MSTRRIAVRHDLKPVDLAHMQDLHAAMLDQSVPQVRWVLYLMAALLVAFFTWAATSRVDEVTKGNAKVIASSGEQMIQSLEGGLLHHLYVREGDRVEPGQVLLEVDATRANAAYKEGMNKQWALQASLARLRAEAYGRPLIFPTELQGKTEFIRNETLAYNSRRQSLEQSLADVQRSLDLAQEEVRMSEPLAARGLISDIELLRMKRQVNDFQLQLTERRNKYRAEANNDLVRVESELAQTRENTVARQDTAQRTVFKAPVRGIVKDIRVSTIGGVIQPAAVIMEIVPVDDVLLVEVKIKPQDVAFLQEGMPALVKITAYDFSIYGGLQGTVKHISPDTLREESRTAVATTGEEAYYRVLVQTQETSIRKDDKTLPIIPGMTASVEIRSGEKSILDYLLKPVFKAKEAFRER